MNPDAHPLSASLRGGETGASYEILGKLATGGMAELFLARAPTPNGRPGPVVVLKRILPHLAEDPEFVRMFRDEAYLAATLKHPNIAQVFDIGREGEDYFFTMEYVHGENLRAILRAAQKRGESIPLTHILTVAMGLTASLHHAHEQTDDQGRPLHIVHRDVSPTNVLVAYDGSLKIVDFGIAKAAAGTHVTQAGMLKGKASYMSPEQCRASKVDRRSDVFAIGILLYEMTTLTRLFKGDNELAILHQVLSGAVDAPSSRRPGYPPELERIVLKALAPEPDHRYATAHDLQADLARFGQQNGLRPSTPALGQFLRGLFGNKPLPWQDAPTAPAPEVNLVASPAIPAAPGSHADDGDLTVTRDVNAPAPAQAPPSPRPSAQPSAPAPAAARPARGPASRSPAAKPWRPGGNRRPPAPPAGAPQPRVTPARGRPAAPPPNPHAAAPQPGAIPNTAKQARLGEAPSHAPSRPTAPRTPSVAKPPSPRPPVPRPASARAPSVPAAKAPAPAPVPRPVPRPAARPAGARPPAPARPPASAASYAPPPPDYDIDPEESKTAIAGDAYDPMLEAKTRVSGHSADDVKAFLAAAAPANLASTESASQTLAAKTQVAPTSAEAVRAFIAAGPPADLVGDRPDPLVAKTQLAPATAAELAALAAAAKKAEQRDLFSTPAAPTRPGGKLPPQPQPSSVTIPASGPSKQPRRPSVPAPADLPPPGGSHAAPRAPAPSPAPQDLPPPGGQAAQANRRDTIMNAPVQPAALGGPVRTLAPGAPARAGYAAEADLDDAATMRMNVNDAIAGAAPSPAPSPATHQAPEPAVLATQPQQRSPLGPPMAPIQQWQGATPQGVPSGHTVPMPMVDLDDEPLVVPGRNAKLIAMVVTVIVGLAVGAAVVGFFLLD
ncbi:MAG: protein kinase domain-containing protein [Nannocystales bacterium]